MKDALIVFLCLILLFSCKPAVKKDFVHVVTEWEGKKIIYPDDMVFTLWGQDTLDYSLPRVDYTIVSYVDSVGCMSCKLQLLKWKSFISELDSISQENVPVIFFFHPKNIEELIYRLKFDKYNLPVCVDVDNRFNKLNNFPADMTFQTFLLDKNNKVVAIGNPIHNLKVRELYLKIIQGGEVKYNDEDSVVQTIVDVDEVSISMGNFDWQKEQQATFTIRNIGDKLLAIEGVDTSCGCISVEYSKEPVRPGMDLKIFVIYKADYPEHFSKTVTVYCNSESSPIILKISGDAK